MKYKLLILLLIFVCSIGIVSAAEDVDDSAAAPAAMDIDEEYELSEISYTFTDLDNDMSKSKDTFDMQHDYTFNNQSDAGYVVIEKSNFIINGNNHILDGNKQSGILNITGNNVTINDLVIMKGKSETGIIHSTGEITLNNVTFILNNVTYESDHSKLDGGALASYSGIINCNNCRFIDNYAERGSAIYIQYGTLNLQNTNITSVIPNKYGQVYAFASNVTIDNSDLINISSTYSSALSLSYCTNITITNSRFINLTADMSAGAIGLKREGDLHIKNCEFINTKSFRNGGAIIVDYTDVEDGKHDFNVEILDTVFNNASSGIGGAYIQLGGNLILRNSNFTNNKAHYYGGAIYFSFSYNLIDNCIFSSNSVDLLDDCQTFGGAIYYYANDDNCPDNLAIKNSKFTNNSAYLGNAVYLRDAGYNITNSTFANNTNAIFTVFEEDGNILENNTYNGDSVITNESYPFETPNNSSTWELNSINNTIDVSTLPSRFDLRDWGWVSSVKDQGNMGSCWTFAMMSAMESALLKAYGIEFDLSEGNMLRTMLKYTPYGFTSNYEGADVRVSSSYLVDWLGPILEEEDIYDEYGKLSQFKTSTCDVIHVQDIIFIINDETGISKIKSAILNYGALDGSYCADHGDKGYYNPKTAAQYQDEAEFSNHEISIIGWDDNFSKDNFLITPPGDGAWIIKNSWGKEFGDNGIIYISYYDKTFLQSGQLPDNAAGIIIGNTVPYNKNYQYDNILEDFTDDLYPNLIGNITYANQFEAVDDDLIAGIGTYFNSSDINYTLEIYVNGELKLTQYGVSPYRGYHTIKLNEYIPIKKGDIFKAAVTSNAIPYTSAFKFYTKFMHYTENMSFYYSNNEWIDLYEQYNLIACLKVYTVEDAKHNTAIIAPNESILITSAIEGYDYQFTLKDKNETALSNKEVSVSFNGKNQTVTTDSTGSGIATLNANADGVYTVEITFSGDDDYYGIVQNAEIAVNKVNTTLTVPDVIALYNTSSSVVATLKDAYGNVISGVNVKITVGDIAKTLKTNANGQVTLDISSLDVGNYTIKAKSASTNIYNWATPVTATAEIVSKLPTTLTVPDVVAVYNTTGSVVATLKDVYGKVIKGVNVKITVGNLAKTLKTDANGQATLDISSLTPGNYTIKVKSASTDTYTWATPVTAKAIVSQDKVKTVLAVTDVVAVYNTTGSVVATLKDVYGNAVSGVNVKITVGDIAKTLKTDANGQATLDISSLTPGNYTIKVKSASTDTYTWAAPVTANAIVNKINTTLTAPDVVTTYNSGGKVVATLKDAYGSAISGVNVKITVGDIAKTLKTNASGQVALDISSLAPGNYTTSIKSASTSIYTWATPIKTNVLVKSK